MKLTKLQMTAMNHIVKKEKHNRKCYITVGKNKQFTMSTINALVKKGLIHIIKQTTGMVVVEGSYEIV